MGKRRTSGLCHTGNDRADGEYSLVSASPVGSHISCETELIETDGRRLVFKVSASDECGLIGEGTHERFVINTDKFMARTEAKLK